MPVSVLIIDKIRILNELNTGIQKIKKISTPKTKIIIKDQYHFFLPKNAIT